MAAATILFTESFAFGFANSLHCAGMCGPLATFFAGDRRAAAGYHTARLVAYTIVGAAAGSIGQLAGTGTLEPRGALVAFVLAAALVLFAFGIDRHLGKVPGLGKLLGRAMRGSRALSPGMRAAVLGLLTPLLPCGLLYAAYSAALLAGDWRAGGLSMLGFAIGSLPLLAFAQLNIGFLQRTLGARGLLLLSRGVMLAAAGVLLWRGLAELQGAPCH